MAADRNMIEAEARGSERVGVKLHAAEHCARVDAACVQGRVNAAEATLTKQHIRAFADEIATGPHLAGSDRSETRRAVRAALAQIGMTGARSDG